MTTAQEDLYSLLINSSPVTALVGDRISPWLADQNTTVPYITYETVSTTNSNHICNHTRVAVNIRIRINVWAASPDSANAIAAACEAALTTGYVETGGELYDEDTERYRTFLDWKVWKS